MKPLLCIVLALGALGAAGAARAQPRIVVTDLAYTPEVSQYFEVATAKGQASLNANRNAIAVTQQSEGTYVAGRYSYVEQRELGSFSNDIKAALLKGSTFRLVQGQAFDSGAPQSTKAEQVLAQVRTGKMATPVRQPQVQDIVARIRKGEFNGAEYVLFGTLTSLQFRDSVTPIQGTSNASHVFSLDLVADYALISTKTFEIKAAFSAQGEGAETKLLSSRGDMLPPNRGKVIRQTSQSLAANVLEQFSDQIALAESGLARQVRPANATRSDAVGTQGMLPPPVKAETITILR